jgi:hypothetical protein
MTVPVSAMINSHRYGHFVIFLEIFHSIKIATMTSIKQFQPTFTYFKAKVLSFYDFSPHLIAPS